MRRILANGTLVTPDGLRRGDLALEGEKIVALAAHVDPEPGDEVEDGLLGLPRLHRRAHAPAVLDRHGLDGRQL